MPKTANVFTRVDPELKIRAEEILSRLGISMSTAMGVFLQQIVLQRGLPFDVKLPKNELKAVEDMSESELNDMIEAAHRQVMAGDGIPFEQVKADLYRLYGI